MLGPEGEHAKGSRKSAVRRVMSSIVGVYMRRNASLEQPDVAQACRALPLVD